MTDGFAIGALVAIVMAGPAIALLFELRGRAPAGRERPPRDGEPCWMELLGEEGGRTLARGQCVDDVLMEMDARAARGEFPIPRIY
jgi:hypothetical protein